VDERQTNLAQFDPVNKQFSPPPKFSKEAYYALRDSSLPAALKEKAAPTVPPSQLKCAGEREITG
jgi:hypothetical protein